MEILDTPMYPPAMTARLAGLSTQRVSRWLRGYEFNRDVNGATIRIKSKPLVKRSGAKGSLFASFLDLVDLLFIKKLLGYGFSIQKLRKMMKEAKRLTDRHHFAQSVFFTDGNRLFMRLMQEDHSGEYALMELFKNGQYAIAPVIEPLTDRIDFSELTEYAERYFPLEGNRKIVVDPAVSFGNPSVFNKGVLTSSIYELYLAENKKVSTVGEWLNIDIDEVESAVEFESRMMRK